MTKNNKLLPAGFCDLIFDEAEKNHRDINAILDLFLTKQFRLIKTPLIEFEDKDFNSDDNFKTVDAISNKTLVFRNDITLQIARLLDSKLKDKELPLKLCYVGDVLCAKNNGFDDRQQTQIGVEVIGCNSQNSSLEVIEIALRALKKVVDTEILIEFSLPDLLDIFLNEVKIDNSLKPELAQAILTKNLSKIRQILPNNSHSLEKTLIKNQDLEEISLEFLQSFPFPKVATELQKAQNILSSLSKSDDVKICFDLFGDHKSLYHNSISFDIFVNGLASPIAKGGRYKINDLDAVGATIYMNQIRKIR